MEWHTGHFYILTFQELNTLVNRSWPAWQHRFDCVSFFEWRNDSDHVVLDVKPSGFWSRHQWDQYDRHQANVYAKWVQGSPPHGDGLPSVLEALCLEKMIPAGHYIIRVSW